MAVFQAFTTAQCEIFLRPRAGEQKIGETISYGTAPEQSEARFVLMGIPEDIGVRANLGIPGAATAWPEFLNSFLNLQESPKLSGRDFLLWGELDCSDWMEQAETADLATLRALTGRIDDLVLPLIHQVVASKKIPIIIGGGHNNAYPLIKGSATALGAGINAINLDAHADFRALEGRHSGNGFSYAYTEGYLKNYSLLGLHEAYNSREMVDTLETNKDFLPIFWEDIFMRAELSWNKALAYALQKICHQPFGVELDVDSIEGALSSAATPVGIHSHHAMEYLYQCGLQSNSIYLHLPEGMSQRADGISDFGTGKLLSYLVQAFCKGVNDRSKATITTHLL